MGGKTLTRADLAEAVVQKVGLPRNESQELVELILHEISASLASGRSVKLSSFGSFGIRKKGERVGRNPKTGQEVPITPRRVLVFRPSNIMKQRINAGLIRRNAASSEYVAEAILFWRGSALSKAAEAFRNIGEVAVELGVKKHVLRFWEAKFPQLKPMKRGGGRRLYRPADVELLKGIRDLLQNAGYTIEGVQRLLREQGVEHVKLAGASCATGAVRHDRARPGRLRRPSLPRVRPCC